MTYSTQLRQQTTELAGSGMVEWIDVETIQYCLELPLIRGSLGALKDHVPKLTDGWKTEGKAAIRRGQHSFGKRGIGSQNITRMICVEQISAHPNSSRRGSMSPSRIC